MLAGFNEKLDKIEYIDYWGTHQYQGYNCIARYVFIIDAKKDHWVKNDKIEGYDWFINNQNILNQIDSLDEIDSMLYNNCQEMQHKMVVNEWNNIITNEDINSILYASLDFHDSIVEKIDKINGDHIVEVTFDTTWECKILIRFENEVDFRCEEKYGVMGDIFYGSIFIEDGFIYWVDCEINFSKEIEKDNCYFRSRKASWKIEIT